MGGDMLGAVAQLAGQGAGLTGQAIQYADQKSFSAKQTRHARKFAEYMSSTAYQRAVKDLEAAGLNPMLAYVQGGASSPGYSVAAGPQARDINLDMEKVVSTARQGGELKARIREAEANAQAAEHLADAASRAGRKADLELIERGKHVEVMQQQLGLMMSEATRNLRSAELLEAEKLLTNTRTRAEGMRIPYSKEQTSVVAEPFRRAKEALGLGPGGALTKWSRRPMVSDEQKATFKSWLRELLGADETSAERE